MPTNQDLIERAELLNRINELTQRISQGAGNLNLSSVQSQNFAKGLELINDKAQEATAGLSRLNQQLLKVAASIESGDPARIRLGGGTRVSTGQFVQPYQAGLAKEGVTVLTEKEAQAERLQARLERITRQQVNLQTKLQTGIVPVTQRPTTQPYTIYPSGGETQQDWNNLFNRFYPTSQTRQVPPTQPVGPTGLGTRMPAWGGWMNGSFSYNRGGTESQYYDVNKGDWWQRWHRYGYGWGTSTPPTNPPPTQASGGYGGRNPPPPTGGRPFTDDSYEPEDYGWSPWGWRRGYGTGGPGGGGPGGGNPNQYSSPFVGPVPNYPFDPFQPFRTRNTGIPVAAKPPWWNAAYQKAQYYGFGAEDLTRISTEATSGISRVNFSKIDEVTGAFKNLNLTVDKTGNVLVDTQRRFRDFFSSVGRNTLEFLKWSLAVTLILGPLRQLSNLIQTAIENETKLASISITLADSQKTVADVFASSAEIAGKAGEEINTVLDAYQIAYRAVGNVADSSERFSQANKLLSDSLVLSKLSGLDEAKAIDTLSAALRQAFTGEGSLSRGTELLDKWIRTTKVANVDLETLATGFAIVGDAADAAGLGVDELNGLIAAIAETGVASGKEVANAARAMISGFQSDQAKKLLASLGISTESEGQVRSFKEILEEIATLRSSGALTGEQFNQLTLTLGGGYRRQAVWSTLIDNYQRIGDVAEASSNAAGDAQEALAKRTETVQTSITRLGNAFQVLAQNLGTKGGLLDLFKNLVELGTGLVKIFDALTGSIGKSFPIALAGIGAALYLGGKTPQAQTMASVGGMLSGAFASKEINPVSLISPAEQQANNRLLWATQFNKSPLGAGITGLATAAIPIISSVQEESYTDAQKWAKAGVLIAGGVAGALITAGNPIGAIIGVTMADAFSSAVIDSINKDYTGAFGNLVAQIKGIEVTEGKKPKTPLEQEIAETEKRIARYAPPPEALTPEELAKTIPGEIGPIPVQQSPEEFQKMLAFQARSAFYKNEGLKKLTAQTLKLTKPETPDYVIRDIQQASTEELLDIVIENTAGTIRDEYIHLKDLLLKQRSQLQGKTGEISQAELDKLYTDNKAIIDSIITSQSEQLFKDYQNQIINKSAYAGGVSQLKNLNILGAKWYSAFGQGQDIEKFFKEAGIISSRGGAETISAINEYATQILKQAAIVKDGTKTEEERANAQKEVNQLMKEFLPLWQQGLDNALANIQQLSVVSAFGMTPGANQLVLKGATQRYQDYLEAQIKAGAFTQQQAEAYTRQLPAFQVQTGEGVGGYTTIPKGILPEQFYQETMQDYQKMGLIPKIGKLEPLQFQSFDLTTKQFTKYLTEDYPKLLAQLESKGYVRNEDTIIPVLKDGILQQMKVDSKVYQLLLSKIEENTRDITGEFNLPEGMQFNIPSRIAELWKNSIDKATENLGYKPGVTGTSGVLPPEISPTRQYPEDWLDKMMERWDRDTTIVRNVEETGFIKNKLEEAKPVEETGFLKNMIEQTFSTIAEETGFLRNMIQQKPIEETGFLKNLIEQQQGIKPVEESGFLKNLIEQPTGMNLLIDKISALNSSLLEFADRPINLSVTTTAIFYMDNKVIGEAVSKYLGNRLSALGGSFVGGVA